MQLPADLKVNGQHYMHLSLRTGGAGLHTALIQFYCDSFGLDRVVFRDEAGILDRAVLADLIGGGDAPSLRSVLVTRGDGTVQDISVENE